MIIETCEESGSFDLPPYLEALSERLGNPDMVVVLDSGGPDYDHIWMTEALRGLVSGTLSVKVSHEGIHSGNSGAQYHLLSGSNGFYWTEWRTHPPERSQSRRCTWKSRRSQGERNLPQGYSRDSIWEQFPTVDTLRQASETTEDMIVAMNWEPTLSIIGADGIPSVQDAGNVLRTNTDLKLSFRYPLGSIRSMLQLVQRKSWRRTPIWGRGHIHS